MKTFKHIYYPLSFNSHLLPLSVRASDDVYNNDLINNLQPDVVGNHFYNLDNVREWEFLCFILNSFALHDNEVFVLEISKNH